MSRKGQRIGSDNKSTMASNGRASAPPANAWSQPLRPKPNAAHHGPPPGMGGKSSGRNPNASSGAMAGNGNSASYGVQNALRERFIGLTLNMVGQKVIVTQTNGAVFEGIFHTFTPFNSLPMETRNKFVIKACRVVKPPTSTAASAADEPQVADQSTVIISSDKVACVQAKSMRIDSLAPSSGASASNSNGSSSKHQQKGGANDPFRTDTEISGGKGGRSKDLVAAGSAWTTGGNTTGSGNSRADALMGALEDGNSKDGKGSRGGGGGGRKPFNSSNNSGGAGGGLRGTIGEWDQFRANQELFNVSATYDENLYTTQLDKSQIDNRKIAEAERLAREIENTASTNLHVAEERGHVLQGDYDEEDRYSGVLKDSAVAATPPPGVTKPKAAGSTSKSSAEPKAAKADDNKPAAAAAPKKIMNYAAAAAKADTAKTTGGPPGFASKPKQTTKAASPAPPPAPEEQQPAAAPAPAPASVPDKETASSSAPSEPEPAKPVKQPSEPVVDKTPPVAEPAKETKPEPAPVAEANKSKPSSESEIKEKADSSVPAEPVKEEKEAPKPAADVAVEKVTAAAAAVTEEPAADSKPQKPATENNAEKASSAKVSSKLNANAKEFTLNPSAKTFTPGGASSAPVPAAPDGQFVDPNAAMHVGQVPGHMPGPHYMHAGPMGHQPGMMPMMNPQFPGVRYPGGYGMDQQHMPQMQPQPQHMAATNNAQGSGAPSPPASGEEEAGQAAAPQEGDAAATQQSSAPPPQQQQQQPPQPGQPQQQPQQVPMAYGVPPHGGYYPGMAMPPRPGAPHPGFHHPQYVGGPQHIPVGPGGAPYRQMYPMQPGGMAPNVQVRGPGAPYYGGPVAPVPYAPHGAYVGHGMMDDDQGFRGGRGTGRGGQGRGRGRGRRSGRGGRGYNSYHQQHGGRHSGNNNQNTQSMPSENWNATGGDGGGAQQQDQSMAGASDQGGKAGEKGSAKQ